MDVLKRRIGGQKREFIVFTKDEADAKGLKYTPWREAVPGGLVLTDDGWVGDCLKISVPARDRYKKVRRLITFSFGRIWDSPYATLLYEPRKTYHDYYSVAPKDWVESEVRKARTKRAVTMYVQQTLLGKVDMAEIGRVYRPDQQIPEATVRRLFKQERIKAMINKEIESELKKRHMGSDYVLDTIKKAIEMALANEDPSTVLKGADMLAEIEEMYPAKGGMPAHLMLEAGIDSSIAASVEAAKKEAEETPYEVVDDTDTIAAAEEAVRNLRDA